ncbi:WbqC family protein [Solibacillus cecembensis]|uniref:WbqC family protein n=1 Tax=Solibacillus cecembensis TaxID=459347 RepID=UPI0007174DAB
MKIKVALMQPYFFPYLGYFQLIHAVDEFIVFDQAQYIRRGWMNRNRILNAQKDSVFINVPVIKAPRDTKIKDITINNTMNWQEEIFHQLSYYKNAPYYKNVLEFLNECLINNSGNLSEFNTSLLRETCALLNIETNITILSQRFPNIDRADAADEWGIIVSKALNATEYINAIGGKEFYSQQKYKENGLEIKFINPILTPYEQYKNNFTPGLSIIDVMMFNDINNIKDMLETREVIG